jgi:hypothetical protein
MLPPLILSLFLFFAPPIETIRLESTDWMNPGRMIPFGTHGFIGMDVGHPDYHFLAMDESFNTIGRFGKKGRGPMEMSQTIGFNVINESEIVVIESGSMKFMVFRCEHGHIKPVREVAFRPRDWFYPLNVVQHNQYYIVLFSEINRRRTKDIIKLVRYDADFRNPEELTTFELTMQDGSSRVTPSSNVLDVHVSGSILQMQNGDYPVLWEFDMTSNRIVRKELNVRPPSKRLNDRLLGGLNRAGIRGYQPVWRQFAVVSQSDLIYDHVMDTGEKHIIRHSLETGYENILLTLTESHRVLAIVENRLYAMNETDPKTPMIETYLLPMN